MEVVVEVETWRVWWRLAFGAELILHRVGVRRRRHHRRWRRLRYLRHCKHLGPPLLLAQQLQSPLGDARGRRLPNLALGRREHRQQPLDEIALLGRIVLGGCRAELRLEKGRALRW